MNLPDDAIQIDDNSWSLACPLCESDCTLTARADSVSAECAWGCDEAQIIKALGLKPNGPADQARPRGGEKENLGGQRQSNGNGGKGQAPQIKERLFPGVRAGGRSAQPEPARDHLAKVPPQDTRTEAAYLGGILLISDKVLQADLLTPLKPTDFYAYSHELIFAGMTRVIGRDMSIDAYTLGFDLTDQGQLEKVGGGSYLAELAAQGEISSAALPNLARRIHELATLRELAHIGSQLAEDVFVPGAVPMAGELVVRVQSQLANINGFVSTKEIIIVEGRNQSEALNAEYLKRAEIIEGLGYSQSIMLVIGGKHSGKTTNLRTLALSVARREPIWKRATSGGPVLYCASDDEIVSTRNELLQMGWLDNDPLYLVRMAPNSDGQSVLTTVGDEAIRVKAVLIIVDMLFDWVGIRDEMSYAQTREAINQLQHLADRTGCLVVASHHTPKYLNEGHNAGNAALGSQGISARFSPIVLVRKWTDGLYTVDSTPTRDPRGKALAPLKIERNESGWIVATGEFKEWMKWEVYGERVMSLFEGGDPTEGFSVQAVADKLEIDRARAQNALYQLTQKGELKREKKGRSYRYYLASTSMFDRDGGEFSRTE